MLIETKGIWSKPSTNWIVGLEWNRLLPKRSLSLAKRSSIFGSRFSSSSKMLYKRILRRSLTENAEGPLLVLVQSAIKRKKMLMTIRAQTQTLNSFNVKRIVSF